ncbi:hypothetical protein KKF34_17475 [Myxococcota bacterium]|nr:hypothetical protein [Myxococcota bacterium]MBU1382464.1 hypothetical protein [Myxococcota bacterium]MBU1498673.1 hypothetical protein [Myxococcota bacterium]
MKQALFLLVILAVSACEDVYPEVVIVNKTRHDVLIKDISYNGCIWSGVLAYGEATAPQKCLPGSDRVHFKKFTATTYEEYDEDALEPLTPTWFNYMTTRSYDASTLDFYLIEIDLEGLEQDFSAPGPYGH